jgi:hypothetical protein
MPMMYTATPATPGNLSTNGSANTETETFFVKPGTRNVSLSRVSVGGKGAGLTTISGIALRLLTWGTASTGGTGITPAPVDPGMQASKATAASRPTSGTTRKNHHVFTCGAAGPGGWVAKEADEKLTLEGSAAGSISMMDISGTVSLNFEFSATIEE